MQYLFELSKTWTFHYKWQIVRSTFHNAVLLFHTCRLTEIEKNGKLQSPSELMHGSILPVTIPPPGNPGDKSSPRVRGWGIVWSGLVLGVEEWGKSKITSCCSCKVRHFSVDMTAPDRVEKIAYFQWKSLVFVADCLEKNNISKLKSVFDGMFIINCWTNVHLMRTRMNGGRHKQRNISSVCLYL